VNEYIDMLTLRVVIAVADCGSISARIWALDLSLGICIFERSPRDVEQTSPCRVNTFIRGA
jgi:hypothetical protein